MNTPLGLSTANISEEAFADFIKQQYDYPPTDETPLEEAFERDATYFGSIGEVLFAFDVKKGSEVLNLREIEVTSITLENLEDLNSGVREIFHNWLSDEISSKYAREWIIDFVQKANLESLTNSDIQTLIPVLICTDDGTITDIGSSSASGVLTKSELCHYNFILDAIKQGVYPWNHMI